MRAVPATLILVAAFVLPGGAGALSARELQFLEDHYTHALVHAAPARDPESTRNAREDECSAGEDLTGPGRLVAMALGDNIQKAGTRVDHVVASPRCDAMMTARLLELVPIDSRDYLAAEPPEGMTAEEQRDEALVYLAGLRPSVTALLVTHGRNIAALTGVETVPGE
ncbi:MAG TPA: hypothetical protein VMM55_14310, partial [Thermohalobaculum sp.]|nr:hypothetical protein [Thermohalobaculum sp.]